jgi:TonB family protein
MSKLLAAVLLISSTFSHASDQVQAQSLLQHAADISNIRTADVGPFRLRAHVQMRTAAPIDGEYLLIWHKPDEWREEIVLGNIRAIRIGGKGTVSIKQDSVPAQAIRSQLRSLDFVAELHLKPDQSLGKVKQKSRNGEKLQCVTRTGRTSESQFCTDALNGTLQTMDDSGHSTTQFLQYQEFKGKQFPKIVTVSHGSKPYAVIEVQELSDDSVVDASLFQPNSQYRTMDGCEHPAVPTLVNGPDPEYPVQLRTGSTQEVELSAIVNERGAVEDLAVARSAGAFDRYAIDALKKWQFHPATCDGRAVPFQFSTQMEFRPY